MVWTDQRVETLRRLKGEGKTAEQIATALGGVTRNAVVGKIYRLGLSKKSGSRRRETTTAHIQDIGTCQWPIGDLDDADFRFCDQTVRPGESYCSDHCERAYKSGKDKKEVASAAA